MSFAPAVSVGPKGTEQKVQIVGLDLLRAFAALLVVLFHLDFWMWRAPGSPIPPGNLPLAGLAAEGWVGVEVFFTLSGFVIAYSAIGSTPGRFLRHRFLRLFPAALVCSTLTAAVQVTLAYPVQKVAPLWWRSITFSPFGPWVDGSYWTLPVEIAFYLLIFATLSLQKGAYLVRVVSFLGVASAVACGLVLFRPSWAPPSLLDFLAAGWFPPQACSLCLYGVFFALGAMLFHVLQRGLQVPSGCILLLCGAGCLAETAYHERYAAAAVQRSPAEPLAVLLWSLAILLMIASVRWNPVLRRLLGRRGVAVSRTLGLATYPLYLLHASIGENFMRALGHRIGLPLALASVVTAVAGLALVVTLQLEPWTRRAVKASMEWGSSLLRRSSARRLAGSR